MKEKAECGLIDEEKRNKRQKERGFIKEDRDREMKKYKMVREKNPA